MYANVRHVAVGELRKLRERSGLRSEEVAGRLKPPMSVRTLARWEEKGIPVRRDEHRDTWLEQLALLYQVDPSQLANGRAA